MRQANLYHQTRWENYDAVMASYTPEKRALLPSRAFEAVLIVPVNNETTTEVSTEVSAEEIETLFNLMG